MTIKNLSAARAAAGTRETAYHAPFKAEGTDIRNAFGVIVGAGIDEVHATVFAASGAILAALRLAKPVCADAYYDALAVQENPTGDAVNYPAENAQATAAALAAWEAVNAAIALAEGREPEPLDVAEADTPDATDVQKPTKCPMSGIPSELPDVCPACGRALHTGCGHGDLVEMDG